MNEEVIKALVLPAAAGDYVHGFSQEEIARVLEIPLGSDTSTTERSKFGQVDVSKLTPAQQKEYQELLNKIQPYFDKLNKASGIE
ncbi:MAG: hypothetical protein ACOY4Q_01300 [Bacillota bacterium]